MKLAGVLHVERRAHKRHDLALRLMFAWQGRVVEGQSIDVSESGMRFQCEVELERGTELTVYFGDVGQMAVNRVDSEVVWVRPSEEILGLFEAGARFTKLEPSVVTALRSTVARSTMGQDDVLPEAAPEDVVEMAAHVEAAKQPPPVESRAIQAAVQKDAVRRQANQQSAELLLASGRAALEAGDVEAAIRILEEGSRSVPDSPELLEELAQALYLKGDVSGAAVLFDRALRVRQERS